MSFAFCLVRTDHVLLLMPTTMVDDFLSCIHALEDMWYFYYMQ